MLRLEDLAFREEQREGGTVIEYVVDGRKKTQTVPRMVGDVLETVVKEVLALKEKERERLADTSGRIGVTTVTAGGAVGIGTIRPAGKGKAKGHPKT